MARNSIRGFSSQIHFVVHAHGDELKEVEPVLLGILAQTTKESELGGRVALRMLSQMERQSRSLPQALAVLLIRGWLYTEDEDLERSFAQKMRNPRLDKSSDTVMAICLKEALREQDEYLKSRCPAGVELLRSIGFRDKLGRFVISAERDCQSETLKVAAHMFLRRSSPAAIIELFKHLPL